MKLLLSLVFAILFCSVTLLSAGEPPTASGPVRSQPSARVAVPDIPTRAAAEARLDPDHAEAIAVVAAKSAPGSAVRIAAAVAREVPSKSASIVQALILLAPAQAAQIIEAVAAAVPSTARELPPYRPGLGRPTLQTGSSADAVIGGNIVVTRNMTISGDLIMPYNGPEPGFYPPPVLNVFLGGDPRRFGTP